MSIEWLLVKTQNKTLGHESRCQPASERPAAHGADGLGEVYLRCECGREGTLSPCGADFKILAEEKGGAVRFECPNCGRHLRYNPLTETITARKGIWGILLGRFS